MARLSRNLARGGCLALVSALTLGACSLPGSGPDAKAAVAALAKGLARGSVAGVAFSGPEQTPVTAYVAILGALRPASVTVGRVSTDGDKATGQLGWTWKVGDKTWTYDTDVSLVKAKTSSGSAWLARWSPTVVEPTLTAGEHLSETDLIAKRGDVLGAGDAPLVTLRPVLRVGLDKSLVPAGEVAAAARRVAALVGIDATSYLKQVTASGDKAFVEAIVYRRDAEPPAVVSAIGAIPGARAIADNLPLAPTKDFASAILGTVGPATAEIVKAGKGRIKAGDDVGLSGLELRYDAQLGGTRGGEIVAVGGTASQRRVLFTAAATPGTPLRTTIVPRLQALAQAALIGVGPASALVAIRPSTGDLVAVASGSGSNGYNTATYGQYAPGSTFKIVSALALLRAGETPATTVPCTPTTTVDGKQFKNYSDYPPSGLGRISLETALANSCNTAFISQHTHLGATSLADAAAALGFGVDHDLGFPSYFGQVGAFGSTTQAAASMIGQGTVLASPMAMATIVASVLKGSTVVPRLLPAAKAVTASPKTPLSATEAAALRTMMRAVVTRGSGIRLAGLSGQVIAKTGTAEFGTTPPLPTHTWMVAGRGDLAVAVFVDRGQSGSQTAGPILQQFLEGSG